MSPIAILPADQQAVLSLLLKQGKSYDELAALLRIDRADVEDRAHSALDTLGPEDLSGLTDERRSEIADYLLGQQSASERAATRQLLEDSAAARAWARVVSAELGDIAGDSLPEIPDGTGSTVTAGVLDAFEGRRTPPAKPSPAGAAGAAGPSPPAKPSSRFGGVILIAVLAVAAIVGIILLVSGGSDKTASTSPPPPPPATSPAGNGSESVESQINLSSTQSKALAVIYVIKTRGHRTLAIAGQDFPPSGPSRGFFYAVWLYNSPSDAKRLGFAPLVGKNSRLVAALDPTRMPAKTAAESAEKQRVTQLMANFYNYKEVVVTRETTNNPTRPGPIIVQGQIKRPSGA